MNDHPQDSSLNTRWSMLDQLRGSEAELSWRWFIDRYRPFARNCLRSLVRGPGLADSAETELWSYLFTSQMFERVDRSRRFRSFLAGTIRNFAKEWLRNNHHAQPDSEDQKSAEPAAVVDLPEDQETRLWARQILHLALNELARSHADNAKVIRWFYGVPESDAAEDMLEPLQVSEIASRLEILPNAVHQVLHRGRQRLRARVEAELRETVKAAEDLEEEMRLIFDAIQREAPGLGG